MLTCVFCEAQASQGTSQVQGKGPSGVLVDEELKSFRKRTQTCGRERQGIRVGLMAQYEK